MRAMTSQLTVTSSAATADQHALYKPSMTAWKLMTNSFFVHNFFISATTSQIKLASCAETADQLSLFDVSQIVDDRAEPEEYFFGS